MTDACQVTDYSRDQLRGMLRDLPQFLDTPPEGRNRTFSRAELLTICVITQMETRYGIKRAAISKIAHKLLATLSGPRAIDPNARLNVVPESSHVTFIAEDAPVSEGLLVPLGSIFQRVDLYLGAHSENGKQGELSLGLGIIRSQANQKSR